LTGLLLLLAPIAVYLLTLPLTKWLKPGLRKLYWVVGAVVVFFGSGAALYLAMYGGDQGGISAYFTYVAVIVVYLLLSCVLIFVNVWLRRKDVKGRGQ